jgi:hypothetical protein
MESVFQESPWEPEEKLQAHYSCKAGNPGNRRLTGALYWTASTTWVELNFSAKRLFFLSNLSSLPP